MDNQINRQQSNYKISENARKAKLNFLNTNITPNYTTIWETITIEETINDDGNIYLKERIPFNLNNDYERPSTTNDLIRETPRSINDEFPSSTKSLSPKNLKKAAVLNDNSFNLKMKNRNLNDVNNDNKLFHKTDNFYFNDNDKFKNRSLSPSEVQLEKWKTIKRFKNQFSKNNNFENSNIEHHQNEHHQNEQPSFYSQTPVTTPEEFIQNNSSENLLSTSSFDHSIDQLPIDNSDYYASLDEEATNYTTDQEKDTDDKLDDHLVNFENYQTQLLTDYNLPDLIDNNQIENQTDNQIEDQIDNQNQANLFIKENYTPRSSIISDEINEHNFIDNDENQLNENYLNPYDYEQYFLKNNELNNNQINEYIPVIQINNLEKSNNNQLNFNDQPNNQSNIEIDEEFDKLLLNYPNIEKFVNNLDSLTNSPTDNNQINNKKSNENINNKLNDNRSSLYKEEELRIPNQVLEIEEPLIQTKNRPKDLNQLVKRRSVIVQTSRPTSIQTTNDDNEDIQHLLTIYNKKNQLTHYAPIKDVYIINRTVYQIQKLSSFILEFRSLLDLIRSKLKRRKLFSMEDNQDQKNNKKSNDKLSNLKLILKWLIANLFSTPGLCGILVVYCLIGAFLFEILEQENNQKEIKKMISYRNETVYRLIDINLNKTLSKIERINITNDILTEFEEKIILKVDLNGYSGNIPEKWSFSDSFLYSVTVISTIGYGKLSPKTFWGQFFTIIFALIGIPIMLLFITNLGTILASLFRVSYDTICCYICNFKNKDEQSNQDDTNNQPATVSEQLTDAKSIELTENKRNQVQQQQKTDHGNQEENSRIHDLETEDSIVVFQNNEYHTNVKERAYYLTYNSEPINRNRVPIRVVILIVFIYVCLGGLVFSFWESNNRKSQDFFKWTYFCFITLSTIGLGDIVPGDSFELRQDLEGSAQILFCVVYLIFGLALIAMSFNLVQEEVIIKMRKICENLGIDYRKRTLTY